MARLVALLAQRIVDEIAREAAEPGPQFFRLAQFAEFPPRCHECFLGQIFTLAEAAGRAVSQRTNQTLIARDNLPEGVAMAALPAG